MKLIRHYQFYLILSLVTLLCACILNILQFDIIGYETLGIAAFSFFTIAVALVLLDELPSSRKDILKKVIHLFHIWEKLKK